MGKKIKIIVTGTTGMVGEGVLHECLLRDDVEQVLSFSRRSCGVNHPKLKEVLHENFFDISAVEQQLIGYDVCLFCLGVSSVGMKEEKYFKLTYTLTLHVAETLSRLNKDMTFCYISGAHTDSTEKGRSMWARVKGKTENDLMKLPFAHVYAFRPAIISPTKGLKNTLSFYKYLGGLLPIIKFFSPNYVCTLKQLGDAMINAAAVGYDKKILEVSDILALSKA